jgi:hypothetical protein
MIAMILNGMNQKYRRSPMEMELERFKQMSTEFYDALKAVHITEDGVALSKHALLDRKHLTTWGCLLGIEMDLYDALMTDPSAFPSDRPFLFYIPQLMEAWRNREKFKGMSAREVIDAQILRSR